MNIFSSLKYMISILLFLFMAHFVSAQNFNSLLLVSSKVSSSSLKINPLAACQPEAAPKKNNQVNKYFAYSQDIKSKQKLHIKIKAVPRGTLKRHTIRESLRPEFDRAIFGTIEGIAMWMMMSDIMYDPPLWVMLNVKFHF